MKDRVIYIKGGRAIEEAGRLFPRLGELPDGGPDKFLLAVLYYATDAVFRLASFGPNTQRTTIEGREVVEYGARSNDKSILKRRLKFSVAAFTFMADNVRFKPTRVLCGVDGPFALFAWLTARLSGAQFVLLAHNAMALPSTSKVYKLSNKFLSRRADLVIAHGPYVKDEAIRLGAKSSVVIEFNNALDPEHKALVESFPPRNDECSKNNVVLYVGRIEKDKGVIDLFHAFKKLSDQILLELHFIGEGSAEQLLRDLVEQQGLVARVKFHGLQPHSQVFRHMYGAMVVVTPSQSRFPEGFCKSAMEAFYVGTPVVAPDYGPFPYMIGHEVNGLLYRADDVDALSEAIDQLMRNPRLLATLSTGAKNSGIALMSPKTSFARAIQRVFSS